MCHHAQIKADYQDFFREHGAIISLKRFSELFWKKRRNNGHWTTIPKAKRKAFRRLRNKDEFDLTKPVAGADREQAGKYEAERSAQIERLAKAEATLAVPKPRPSSPWP
jgi:hypothetical protein